MKQKFEQRVFTASEVAEYEYCPLVWWYEQYEPLVNVNDEDLFAYLVEMEEDYGAQAPALPEYQVTEHLLVRRGAFEQGRQQHQDHAAEVEALHEITEEQNAQPGLHHKMRLLVTILICIVGLAALFILAALLAPR
ncbi:hypothetical protein [Tengunoibacter tsumagoiensis]|uniref:Uncharacterized protein n=1 Tax=Tengunoibacter tsumagoiensis TaxID=2014871 RepID=A0A402A3X9_9CHLR|nr:hypothetical protein [Tengunoibacter tsumagoiensis]GCE13853.1 hypothetical protein KTT_37120 [Tengunoibacter tsumagoiensis]